MADRIRSSSRGFARSHTSRRKTGWEEGPGTNTLVTRSSSGASVLGLGFSVGLDGFTIIRLRGAVELMLTAVASAGDGFAGALGIGMASSTAFAAGVASLPAPISEIGDENWLWHRMFQVHSAQTTAGVIRATVRIEIDSKAMRKFDSGRTVYAAIELTEVGVASMDIRLGTRMLLKVP